MEISRRGEEHRDQAILPDDADLLHCIIDQAAIGMALLGADGHWLYANPAFGNLTGYGQGECVGRGFEDVLHPEEYGDARRRLDELGRSGSGSYQAERCYLRKDGSTLHVLETVSHLGKLKVNSPYRYILQLVDIGVQKQELSVLAETEWRWNQALQGSRQVVWDFDVPAGMVWVSPQWKTLLDLPDEERVHPISAWLSKMHPDDRDKMAEAVERIRVNGDDFFDAPYRLRHHTQDRWIWVLSRGRVVEYAPDGGIKRMIGTIVDITYEKELETRLTAVTERLEVALEAGGIGTYEVDFATGRHNWDDRMHEIFGLPPSTFGGSWDALLALIHPDDVTRVVATRDAAVRQESLYHADYRIRHQASGRIRHVRSIARIIRRDDGSAQRAIGTCWDITSDVERANKLSDSLALTKALLEGTPDLIYVKDRDGRYLLVNPSVEKIMGRSSADIIGRTDAEIFPPEIAQALIENDCRVMDGAKPYTIEEIAIVDGVSRTYSSTKVPRRDEHGQVIGLIGISYDLTEVKKAEAALRQSEARWQFAIDGARDGIWDWNMETGHVFYSHQWKAMLGHEDDEVGSTVNEWLERVHPEDLPRCWAIVQEHLSGGTPNFSFEHRMRAKDGSWHWIFDRGKVVERDEQGQPRRVIGTHTDITARKEEENSIRSLNQRLQLAIEAAQAGIFEFDFKTERYTADNRVYELYDVAREEADHSMTGWLALLHPDDIPRVISEYKNATRETSAFNLDFRVIHPRTGAVRYIRSLARVIRDDSGSPVRSVGMIWDVTEAVELRLQNLQLIEKLRLEMATAEAARREAESANRAKSKFLAAASHDLRQPIHAQGLFLEVLARTDLSPAQRDVLANALAACRASGEMLNTLLDFSRLEAGVVAANKRAFRLQPLLNKIAVELAPLADQKNIVYRMHETAAVVYSDPVLLELILRNLISNAIRYTERGGMLIGCRKRGQKLSVEIWDTGIGIAAENRNTIFREFHQLGNPERDRRKGLGLGLAITDRLVRTLGENLLLSSRVGRGSKFAITVPLAKKQLLHEPAQTSNPSIGTLDLQALVIEDDEAARLGMQFLLQSWGARCEAVETIEEALAKAASRRPDVVICDYRLRDRRTGIEAIAALRQMYPELPAILVTGDTAPERLREGQTSGIPLLHKPVMPDKLYLKITDLLAARLT